jgi:outer membrane protein TolC
MEACRRTLFVCAAAVLGAAAGCTTPRASDAPPDTPSGTARASRPEPLPPLPPVPTLPRSGGTPQPVKPAGGVLSPDGTPAARPDAPLPINLATALRLGGARPPDVQIAGRHVSAAAAALAAGPAAAFAFSEALYAPLAARQELRADEPAAAPDSTSAVVEAYFGVQQARGELAGALAAEARAVELERKATALAKGLAPPADENRVRAELGHRRQAVAAARERCRAAGAELARLLRLNPTAAVEPVEPPGLSVTVIDPAVGLDDLIPVALRTRPELAGREAVVEATLARLKQDRLRPLVPSRAARSAPEPATSEVYRTQDRIAAEVAARFAAARSAAERVAAAGPALAEANELVRKSVEGLGQTRRVGDALALVVRPQEAVAAVQAFAQANADVCAAVADYNRAQFRLYLALGRPARCLAAPEPPAPAAPVSNARPESKPPAQPAPPRAVLSMRPAPPPPVVPAGGVLPPEPLKPPVVVAETADRPVPPLLPVPPPRPVLEREPEWQPLPPPVVVPESGN